MVGADRRQCAQIDLGGLATEGRRLQHNPATRECRLASVTSFTFHGDHIVRVDYAEPAASLYPPKKKMFRPGM